MRRLAEEGELLAVSGVYETPPWGDTEQPAYYNAALLVRGPQSVEQWLLTAQGIEHEAGRVRHQARRYSPRTLDVDLVAAFAEDGEPIMRDTPELTCRTRTPTSAPSCCGRGWRCSPTPSCPGTAG